MRRAVRSLVLLALVTSLACSKEKRREPEPAAPDPNAPISAGGGPIDEAATPVTPDPAAGEAKPTDEGEPTEAAGTPPTETPPEATPGETKPVDSRPARPARPASTPDSTGAPEPRGDRADQGEGDEPDETASGEKPAASDPKYPDGAKPNIPQKPRKPGSGGSGSPAQGQPCADGHCAPGLRCVEYYGIAGPRGPAFSSCEIQCPGGKGCPAGQHCTTIADGPGQVCRPGS